MTIEKQDIWAQWLLKRRFAGDPQAMQKMLGFLYPIRDKVLRRIHLRPEGTLLDAGCGDGLIAFGALEKFESCRVIFSDISQDLLNHAETLAQETGLRDRCEFLRAPADDLTPLADRSVEAVTTRSVLIYVADKQKSFHEFHRVLKPGGELSIFEPINRFNWPEPPGRFAGYDILPVSELAQKLMAVFERLQPRDTDPMANFDERDLVSHAEQAGFAEIHLQLQIDIVPLEQEDWHRFINTAWNPKVPTLAEAMQQVLTQPEAEQFTGHLRPLVEAGQGSRRLAVAYLWAVK